MVVATITDATMVVRNPPPASMTRTAPPPRGISRLNRQSGRRELVIPEDLIVHQQSGSRELDLVEPVERCNAMWVFNFMTTAEPNTDDTLLGLLKVGREEYDDTAVLRRIRHNPGGVAVRYQFDRHGRRPAASIYPVLRILELGGSLLTYRTCRHACAGASVTPRPPPGPDDADQDVGPPTFLHAACTYRAPAEVVKYIYRHDPTALAATDAHGCTPLHCACAHGSSVCVVNFLVRAHKGSLHHDIRQALTAKNRLGERPCDIAAKNGAPMEVVTALSDRNIFLVKPLNLTDSSKPERALTSDEQEQEISELPPTFTPIASRCVASHPTTLLVQGGSRTPGATLGSVLDAAGNLVFDVCAKAWTLSGRRVLRDARGAEVGQAKRKHPTPPGVRAEWFLGPMDNAKKCSVRRASDRPKGGQGQGHAWDAALCLGAKEIGAVRGDRREKSFTISIGKNQVAEVTRGDPPSADGPTSGGARPRRLEIAAGVDAVFVVLVVVGLAAIEADIALKPKKGCR